MAENPEKGTEDQAKFTYKVTRQRKPKPPKTAQETEFNHERYTKEQCKKLNKSFAEQGGSYAFIPVKDNLGPFCILAPHNWTAETKTAFLDHGKLPVTIGDVYADDKICKSAMTLVIAQMRGQSFAFPGHADDLGRAACLLRVTHAEDKPFVLLEPVDDPAASNGQASMVAFVPNEVVNTPERKAIGDEYLKSGKSEVAQLLIKEIPTAGLKAFPGNFKPGGGPKPKIKDFNQRAYSELMYYKLMKIYVNHGHGIAFQLDDGRGPRSAYMPFEWSEDQKQAYFRHGKLPIQHNDTPRMQPMMLINYAQFRLNSEQFPGYSDDLGRPESFIHTTHAERGLPGLYILEPVDGPRASDGTSEYYYAISSGMLASPERRVTNDNFIRNGEKRLNKLIETSKLIVFKARLENVL